MSARTEIAVRAAELLERAERQLDRGDVATALRTLLDAGALLDECLLDAWAADGGEQAAPSAGDRGR